MTISPFNPLLRCRVNEVKALERCVAGRIKVVDLHPVKEVEFWEQVKALPRSPLEVIFLHYADDMSTGEIAEVLDISESSLRTHLQWGWETLVRKVDAGG